MKIRFITSTFFTSSLAIALGHRAAPVCTDVRIPVSATATNKVFPDSFDAANLSSYSVTELQAIYSNADDVELVRDFEIAARFCEPTKVVPQRTQTLQILVHGIFENKNYWSGLDPPGQSFNGTFYSWVDYAANEGYPTLSIDRICNGESSRLNGLLECQLALGAAALNGVIEAARSGLVGGRSFNKVIVAGHSFGSLTSNIVSRLNPKAADAYILTGYTPKLLIGAPGTTVALALPVSLLTPFYLRATSKQGLLKIAYFPQGFAPEVYDIDFAKRGTVTGGELASFLEGQLPALPYQGDLLVLNGRNDQIFCSRNVFDGFVGFRGDCGSGDTSYSAQVQALFPNAKNFEWHQYDTTGHNLNLHYSGQDAFRDAHDYLARVGY